MGWAVFFSLAATGKIEFSFFSSCYLDVSVRRVLLHKAMYLLYDVCVFHRRVSPFGDLGVFAFCELALVFVHLRPSSSSCAKASTWRPFFLDWKYCLLFSFYWFIANSLANLHGGDKEIRTLDPLRARQVLSQLSYTPIYLISMNT